MRKIIFLNQIFRPIYLLMFAGDDFPVQGGNPEVVLDGQTGRLVPAGDPDALARAIVDLCAERDLWPAMGTLSRQRVEQHFEIRQMIRSYEALYEELLK